MNVGELLEHTRTRYLRDSEAPFLWSAQELLQYLNEAETIFARRTHALSDDSSDFTLLTTVAGTSKYDLDPRVIYVSEVYDATTRKLKNVTRHKLPHTPYSGKPVAYTLDAAVRTIRFGPTPDDTYEFQLVVARKPLQAMVTQYDSPEIPEEYHVALCDYVAYKALRNNDTEASNTTAAENFRVDWEKWLIEAKRDAYHLRAGNSPRVANSWADGWR